MNKRHIHDGIVYMEHAGGLRVLGFADKADTRRKLFIPEHLFLPTNSGEIKKWSVVEISKAAFVDSEHIQRVEFPKTVSVIGHYAFQNCKNLKEVTCTTNGWFNGGIGLQTGAFQGCGKLQKVRLNRVVSWVANEAFSGCSHLEIFDANIRSVSKDSFKNCNLKRLAFTSNAKIHGNSIEESGVQELVFKDNMAYTTQQTWKWIKKSGITIYCPEHSRLTDLAYEGVHVEVTPARK